VVAVHFANALVNRESEEAMDLACLAGLRLESALPLWRQMYEEMTEKPGADTNPVRR
jgi:hypothetical protein